jgi:hypothetical protein
MLGNGSRKSDINSDTPHATGRTWTTTHPWSSSKRTSSMTVFSAPRTARNRLFARTPFSCTWFLVLDSSET